MFDIGFTELLLLAIVGLLVIGPRQLPETVRLITSWVQRTKQTWSHFKARIEKELDIEDMTLQLRRESIVTEYNSSKAKLEEIGDGLQQANIDLMNSFTFSEESNLSDKSSAVKTD